MAYKIVLQSVDARLAELAARQHGVITLAQCAALGLARDVVAGRVRAGRLHRVYQGVFAVGHPRLTDEGRFLAAVFACGHGAVLSHRSAAAHWGLIQPRRSPRVDVTVPRGGQRARRRALIVHRSGLPAGAVTVHHSIPVTTPARTLVDLADVVEDREFERTVDQAHHLRLDLTGLAPIPGRRGAGRLRRVLADHAPGTTRTRSQLEERMLALCRRARLPAPLVNQRIEGFEVDFAWPHARLIVETDGWEAHGTRSAFERDRLRDAVLTAAGWRVVRITWRQLEREPDHVGGLLGRLIAEPGFDISAAPAWPITTTS